VRTVVFWILATPMTILASIVGALALLLGPRSGRASHRVERLWGKGILFAAGARLRVENLERLARDRTRLVVANHTSWLDPPALFAALPLRVRVVMKRELVHLPFAGWYVRLAGHFFLDRADPRQGMEVLRHATERAKRYRLTPVLFPEGTRSPDGLLAPFKTGAFQLALAGGFDVQPTAILGSHEIFPKHARGPRRGGEIRVRIGEAIPVEGLAGSPGRKVLSEKVRAALVELGVPTRGSPE
jgi:1-acyl-sn-glycerol-3-phosphate acyltransferase